MTVEEYACGLGGWRPHCLQVFANKTTFLAVFGLLGTVQAMAFVYFVATLTTLEKRFQMPSETMGILMSGNEISQILLVLVLSYLGGKGNRPRWIAWGVSISALSSFVLASPHFLYGPGAAALALTAEHLTLSAVNGTHLHFANDTRSGSPYGCDPGRESVQCSSDAVSPSLVPMILVFLSQFVLGIGTSLYFSLGQTYMDDNTKKSSTPMLLGITMSLRTLGPAFGFLLGSLCLSVYVDPTLTPLIERRDPRWLGAWWLGWVILGSTMLMFAILIGSFPKTLPKRRSDSIDARAWKSNPTYMAVSTRSDIIRKPSATKTIQEMVDEDKMRFTQIPKLEPPPQHKDSFLTAIKRIITNQVLMVNNFTAVFYILGASGYMTFYNKYTENQFGASASFANTVAGVSTLFSLVAGFLVSGFLISKFKPRTSYLLIWNIFVGCVYMGGEILLMFVGCPDNIYAGTVTESGFLDAMSECNSGCGCESVKYSPICDTATNKTYFSACHAGCSSMNITEAGKRIFSNCLCTGDGTGTLTEGSCPLECGSNLYMFMAVVCIMQMIGCTGRITNCLINYRSVLPQDKSIAQGLALFLISLFAFIPGPIIYGKIIDNACVIWDNTCGEKGNCWLYDKTDFRLYLNSTAASFSAVAILLDIVLWYKGRHISIYEEEENRVISS